MKLQKTFDVNYFKCTRPFAPDGGERVWSHKYTETWAATDLYCPSCGKKEVWTEEGPADYDDGAKSFCVACGATHYLDRSGPADSEQDKQRLEALCGSG